MFQTRLKTALKLLFLTLALLTSLLIGSTTTRAASAAPDFSLSANPTARTIQRGGTATYAIHVQALNGFTGTVNLTVTGIPNHDSAFFTNTSVTGTGDTTLNVHSAGHQSPLGTSTLTITGTSGSLQHTIQVKYTVIPVPDFSLSSNPFVQTVKPGTTAAYLISVSVVPGTGFTGTVTLGLTGSLPANSSASFSATSVTVPGTSELDIHTSTQTPTGSFGLSVTGTSGNLGHFTDITLEVIPPTSDFTLSTSPTSQTIHRGGLNAVYTIHVGSKNGFAGTVNFTSTGAPAGDLGFFGPFSSSVTAPGDIDFIFNTSAQSPLGTFTLTVTGTSGPLQHSIQVTCTVIP